MKYLNAYSAIVVLLIWTSISLLPNIYKLNGKTQVLGEDLGNGPAYAILGAAVFILLVSIFSGNTKVTGLDFKNIQNLKILNLQIFVILLIAAFLLYHFDLINMKALAWTLGNCFFVGISEEMMFRGVLLSSFTKSWGFRKAAIAVIFIFGLVHILNAFITGELGQGILQAFMAMSSGVLFLAYRVNNLTIVFAIVLHAIWDFLVIQLSYTVKLINTEENMIMNLIISLVLFISPIVFGIYGLYLLKRKKAVDDYLVSQNLNYQA
jgi:membrane protease YdiL (CAAX protease family)